jgi:hypothetical protein
MGGGVLSGPAVVMIVGIQFSEVADQTGSEVKTSRSRRPVG